MNETDVNKQWLYSRNELKSYCQYSWWMGFAAGTIAGVAILTIWRTWL